MSFKEILGKIKEEKVLADTDLNAVSPRAYPYKKGQVDRARENLESLYIDYKNQVLKNAVFILVTGEDSEEFSTIAEEEFNCFKVDAMSFYEEIVDTLSPELYVQKNLNSSVFDIAGNVLEDKMKNLDVVAYNSLTFSSKYAKFVKTKKEMVQIMKDAINDSVGGEIIGLDALERVSKEAVNKDYQKRVVPILLHSRDENFLIELSSSLRKINPRVVRIVAGKTDNKDINPLFSVKKTDKSSVGDALEKIAENA
jgi:ribosomal protein S17